MWPDASTGQAAARCRALARAAGRNGGNSHHAHTLEVVLRRGGGRGRADPGRPGRCRCRGHGARRGGRSRTRRPHPARPGQQGLRLRAGRQPDRRGRHVHPDPERAGQRRGDLRAAGDLRLRPGHGRDRPGVLAGHQRHGQRAGAGTQQHGLRGWHLHHRQRRHGEPQPRAAVRGHRPADRAARAGHERRRQRSGAQRGPALRRRRLHDRGGSTARRPGHAQPDVRRDRPVHGRRRHGEPQLGGGRDRRRPHARSASTGSTSPRTARGWSRPATSPSPTARPATRP